MFSHKFFTLGLSFIALAVLAVFLGLVLGGWAIDRKNANIRVQTQKHNPMPRIASKTPAALSVKPDILLQPPSASSLEVPPVEITPSDLETIPSSPIRRRAGEEALKNTHPKGNNPQADNSQISISALESSLKTETPILSDGSESPWLVIIIDDLGVDQERSREIVDMIGPYSLSFLPYGRNLQSLVDRARQSGHDILLHLPMEPLDKAADPGPNALRVGAAPWQLQQRIDWALQRFEGFSGLNNHMGSRFTAWRPGMEQLMASLAGSNLFYVDSLTTKQTLAESAAREHGVPVLLRDVFLDNDRNPETIRDNLARMVRIAKKRGYAIGICHPYPETISVLRDWRQQEQQLEFRTISELVARLREEKR